MYTVRRERERRVYNVHASLYSNFFLLLFVLFISTCIIVFLPIFFNFIPIQILFLPLSLSIYFSFTFLVSLEFCHLFRMLAFFLYLCVCVCFLERTMQYVNVLTPWNKWKDALKNDVIERFVECVSKALHVCFGSLSHSQSSYKRIQLIFAGTVFFFFFQSDLTATRQNTPRRCLPN